MKKQIINNVLLFKMKLLKNLNKKMKVIPVLVMKMRKKKKKKIKKKNVKKKKMEIKLIKLSLILMKELNYLQKKWDGLMKKILVI